MRHPTSPLLLSTLRLGVNGFRTISIKFACRSFGSKNGVSHFVVIEQLRMWESSASSMEAFNVAKADPPRMAEDMTDFDYIADSLNSKDDSADLLDKHLQSARGQEKRKQLVPKQSNESSQPRLRQLVGCEQSGPINKTERCMFSSASSSGAALCSLCSLVSLCSLCSMC